MNPGPISGAHTSGPKVEECVPGVGASGEKDEWNSTVASVLLGGCHTATHTQTRAHTHAHARTRASQRFEVTRLLNVLNIGRLIRSVEKQQPGDGAHSHKETPQHTQLLSNWREHENAANSSDELVTVNQPTSRQSKIVCHERKKFWLT